MSEFLHSADLWLPGMLAMALLTVASGFFSSSETAIFYLSHDELRLFRIGKPRERLVANLLLDADRLLTGVLFWNLVINLTYFSVSVAVMQRLAGAGQRVAAGFFALASLIAMILFGEVVPKSVAVVFRRKIASWNSYPLALAVRVLDPITPFLRQVTRVLRRAFWPHIVREPYLEAEDLEQAVENSLLSDEVIRHEREVLHNILDLSEITVEEVMRPRGTYLTVAPPFDLSELREDDLAGDYVAICEPGSDEIDGTVALGNFSLIPERNLEDAAEEIVHVPWCSNLAYTLQLLRDRFCSLAVVVNEYGETVGIVTYEDIIDTVLMPQPSRAKRLLQREPVLEVAPGSYHVDALTTLRYLCTRLEIEYEPTSDGLITVGGLLQDELERIPVVGDECDWRGFHLKVIDASKRGQLRVMLSKAASAAK